MTATAAVIGMGLTVAFGDGAGPEVFTALTEVTLATPPNLSRDTIDATHMLSSARFREYIGGLRDGGEVPLEMADVPSNFTALKAKYDSDVPSNVKITFAIRPGNTTAGSVTFPGLVTSIEPTAPMDGKRMISSKIKVAGAPTYVAGS